MADTEYKFSIADDTKNSAVDPDRLKLDIIACSSISTGLSYISSLGDVLKVWMVAAITTKVWEGHWDSGTTYDVDDAVAFGGHAYVCIQSHSNQQPPNAAYWELMTGEIEALCGVVKAHTGEPLPKEVTVVTTETTTEDGSPIFSLDTPQESDKKFVFVVSPATEGTFTWLSSRGDDLSPTPPSSGRGEGTQALLSFTEPDTKEVEIQFCEPVELHDGHVSWKPASSWDFEDSWSLIVRLPATVATPNVGNTGNCNLVATGLGFNIVVPAAGDGAYDVDLDDAVPVPDGYNKKTQLGTGYWDVERYWSETITANVEGEGEFNLYDTEIDMSFCKNMDCGHPLGIWDLDAYKAEWISKKWKICFKVTKVTAGAGKIGGYLMIFRPGAT